MSTTASLDRILRRSSDVFHNEHLMAIESSKNNFGFFASFYILFKVTKTPVFNGVVISYLTFTNFSHTFQNEVETANNILSIKMIMGWF